MTKKVLSGKELRELSRSHNDVQQLRISIGNRNRQGIGIKGKEKLEDLENDLKKQMEEILELEELYVDFLENIRGCGPGLSAAIIGELTSKTTIKQCAECKKKDNSKTFCNNCERIYNERTVNDFPSSAHLWAYTGYGLKNGEILKRKKGQKANWNQFLKMTLWKWAQNQIKQGRTYRKIYDERKKYEQAQNKERKSKLTDGHIHNRTTRYMIKKFLSHLWYFWKGEFEGELPK